MILYVGKNYILQTKSYSLFAIFRQPFENFPFKHGFHLTFFMFSEFHSETSPFGELGRKISDKKRKKTK